MVIARTRSGLPRDLNDYLWTPLDALPRGHRSPAMRWWVDIANARTTLLRPVGDHL